MAKLLKTKTQFRKMIKKGVLKQLSMHSFSLSESFGIQALESGRVSQKFLKEISLLLPRLSKKGSKGKVICLVSLNQAITAKPIEVRMGKGKGSVKDRVANVKKGAIIFEIRGGKNSINMNFLKKICLRFPIKTMIIKFKRF